MTSAMMGRTHDDVVGQVLNGLHGLSETAFGTFLPGIKNAQDGKTGKIKCPFHKDTEDSLIVYYNDELSASCYGACNKQYRIFDFVMLQNRCGIMDACRIIADKFSLNVSISKKNTKFKQTAIYLYHNEKLKVAYQRRRFEDENGKKVVPYYRYIDGKWTTRAGIMDGVKHYLYGLKDIKERDPEWLLIVEGEKDRDSLQKYLDAYNSVPGIEKFNAVAMSGDNGASSKFHPHYHRYCDNRKIAILPDYNNPGERYANTWTNNLQKTVPLIRIISPQTLGLKQDEDMGDWLEKHNAGKSIEDIVKKLIEYIYKTENLVLSNELEQVFTITKEAKECIVKCILYTNLLKPRDKTILLILISHIGDNPNCFVSYKILAKEANCAENTVIDSVDVIESTGFMNVKRGERMGRSQKTQVNYYSLRPHPILLKALDEHERATSKIAVGTEME